MNVNACVVCGVPLGSRLLCSFARSDRPPRTHTHTCPLNNIIKYFSLFFIDYELYRLDNLTDYTRLWLMPGELMAVWWQVSKYHKAKQSLHTHTHAANPMRIMRLSDFTDNRSKKHAAAALNRFMKSNTEEQSSGERGILQNLGTNESMICYY